MNDIQVDGGLLSDFLAAGAQIILPAATVGLAVLIAMAILFVLVRSWWRTRRYRSGDF